LRRNGADRITAKELPVAAKVAQMLEGTALATKVAWGNDEADPKVHWSSWYDWQADARYAAMVSACVHACVGTVCSACMAPSVNRHL
jgi:hypothetical protein